MIHSPRAANIYMPLANIMWHYGKDFTTKLSIIKALAKTTVYYRTFFKTTVVIILYHYSNYYCNRLIVMSTVKFTAPL